MAALAPPAPAPDPGAPGMDGVRLVGHKLVARLVNAVQDCEETETMEGASTVTLTLLDEDDELLDSGIFDGDLDVEVDEDRWYRLVAVESRYPSLVLTFEDIDVWRLRQRRRPRKANRKKVTRGEFILALVREVRPKIRFFSPEAHREQRIAKPTKTRKKRDGFPRGADVKVKGRAANSGQRRLLDQVFGVGVDMKLPQAALVAADMCVTVESAAQNLRGGDRDSVGAFQQRRSQGWPASRDVVKDARAFYRAFMPLWRKHRASRDLGWIVDETQRSQTHGTGSQGTAYERWRREAERNVSLWTGGGGSGSSTRRKAYVFRRGEPGKPEDSWTCIKRLADEVKWRAFMRRGELWYVREEWLIARAASLVLRRSSPGVQSISFSWDAGKKAQTASLTIMASHWTALPGDRVDLAGLGKGSGRYLVATARRRRFSPLVTIDLKRPAAASPEPAAETISTGRESGGKGGDQRLRWPTTKHNVSSGFGHRASPGGIGSTNHDGIDIGVAVGTTVYAAEDGKVTRAGVNGGYGNYVEIDHGGGLVTFYGHLSKIGVKAGQRVKRGDKIAESGNTGASTGPHLHFGVHSHGRARDPRDFLP